MEVNCPVCRSASHSKCVDEFGRIILKCRICRLLFFKDMPSPKVIEDYYRTYSYGEPVAPDPITQFSFNEVLSRLHEMLGGVELKILDFGCGQGDFLKAAARRGFDAHGMEFSDAAVLLCRQAGLTCSLVKSFEEARASIGVGNNYNVVTAFELIEHLPCPMDFLAFAQDLLPPGGILFLTTPNTRSLDNFINGGISVLAYPEHVCGFRPHTFRVLSNLPFMVIEHIETRGSNLAALRALRRVSSRINLTSEESMASQGQVDKALKLPSKGKVTGIGMLVTLSRYLLNLLISFTGMGSTIRVFYRKL